MIHISMGYLVRVCADRYTKSSCKAKVSELDLTLSIDEEILRFQISMKNPVRVAEGQALQQLEQITLKAQKYTYTATQSRHDVLFAGLVVVYLDER